MSCESGQLSSPLSALEYTLSTAPALFCLFWQITNHYRLVYEQPHFSDVNFMLGTASAERQAFKKCIESPSAYTTCLLRAMF